MNIHEAVVGLLGLVTVFLGSVKEKAEAFVRAVPEDRDDMGIVKAGGQILVPPSSFFRSSSIPRGNLFQRLLRTVVIRRGNDDSEERICVRS